MVKSFCIDLFDGHLIFEDNGQKVLVDTGSPVTIGMDSHFDFMGNQYNCHTNFLGKNIPEISEMMGYDIDVLMGLDLLRQFYIQTDYQSKKITFSSEEMLFEAICSVPIIQENGVVCINLIVDGRSAKLALDTGAKISYIDKSYTDGRTIVETREDFSPLINRTFNTPIYSMEAIIGDQPFPVNFGNLPSEIAMMLRAMGLLGAIGFDLFNAFTVHLDFNKNELSLSR
jgi:hypothetical protein